MSVKLPDARSLSAEVLEAFRLRAIHAVEELGLAQTEVARILGVSPEVVNRWCAAYRQAGLEALQAGPQGRPVGSGRALRGYPRRAIVARLGRGESDIAIIRGE
jgi:transposase-like protein